MPENKHKKFFLASNSFIRKQILQKAGYEFYSFPAFIEDEPDAAEEQSSESLSLQTARIKAKSFFFKQNLLKAIYLYHQDNSNYKNLLNLSLEKRTESLFNLLEKNKDIVIPKNLEDLIVIGSDQLVEFEGKILKKVKADITIKSDKKENNYLDLKNKFNKTLFDKAFNRLRKFSSKEHFLVGAISIYRKGKEIFHSNSRIKITMHKLSDIEIKNYLEREKPYSSVSCYYLEAEGIKLIKNIEGSFHSALGLDLFSLQNFLRNYQSRLQD